MVQMFSVHVLNFVFVKSSKLYVHVLILLLFFSMAFSFLFQQFLFLIMQLLFFPFQQLLIAALWTKIILDVFYLQCMQQNNFPRNQNSRVWRKQNYINDWTPTLLSLTQGCYTFICLFNILLKIILSRTQLNLH